MQIQNRPTSCGYVLNAIYMNSVLQNTLNIHSAAITDALGYFKSQYNRHGQYHDQLNAVPALLCYLVT
jgi:hypothetical protein